MKFMIDRCAGRTLANWLAASGHDVVHVAELGEDPGDAILLQKARQQGRIFVTIDTDFGALVFRDAASHPAPATVDGEFDHRRSCALVTV